MAREIRYCTTEDGIRIAYSVEGDAPTTILALPCYVESFALDHLMPVYQQFYRDMGEGRRIVRLDWRETGLSADVPAGATPATNAERVADLKAVATAVGSRVAVWASTIAGPPAIAFAIAHPDLVTRLILYDTFAAEVNDQPGRSTHDVLVELARTNWDLAAQTIADTNGRREFPEEAAQLGEWYLRSMSGDRFVALMTERRLRPYEMQDPSRVAVPTLVMHRIADPIIPFSAGQRLAAGIPNARFVPLEGRGHMFCLGDYSNILVAVDNFLGDRAQGPTCHSHVRPGGSSAVPARSSLPTSLATPR